MEQSYDMYNDEALTEKYTLFILFSAQPPHKYNNIIGKLNIDIKITYIIGKVYDQINRKSMTCL